MIDMAFLCPQCGQASHDGRYIDKQESACLHDLAIRGGEVSAELARVQAERDALLSAVEDLADGWEVDAEIAASPPLYPGPIAKAVTLRHCADVLRALLRKGDE